MKVRTKDMHIFNVIKDRNVMDLTEAEDIKRWQIYTEELSKKIFTIKIITMV